MFLRFFARTGSALLVTLLIFTSRPSYGQEVPVVKLDDLVKEALEKNPEILAAKGMWEMAKAKAPQVKALPDPMLQFELQNIGAQIRQQPAGQPAELPGAVQYRAAVEHRWSPARLQPLCR